MCDCVSIKSERSTGCYARAFPAHSFAPVLDFREPRETNLWEPERDEYVTIKHDRVDRDVRTSNEDFWMELLLYLSLTMIGDTWIWWEIRTMRFFEIHARICHVSILVTRISYSISTVREFKAR